MRVDLHNHTKYCNHAIGEMEEYVLRAIEKKIDVFGFSDHAPMDFDPKYRMSLDEAHIYSEEIDRLQTKYASQIKILFGYEVDYLESFMLSSILEADVDYLIGSVHFIKEWGFDNPEFIGKYQEKNIDQIWEEYFEAIAAMANFGKFDIVGHLDLIKVFKFLPQKSIATIATNAIKAIKKANMCVEINPSGFRKPIAEQYPSKELLQICFEHEIPITFGSDAHAIEQIDLNMDRAKQLAREVGYTKCAIFSKRDRQLVSF